MMDFGVGDGVSRLATLPTICCGRESRPQHKSLLFVFFRKEKDFLCRGHHLWSPTTGGGSDEAFRLVSRDRRGQASNRLRVFCYKAGCNLGLHNPL
jgi:hypothetical protein